MNCDTIDSIIDDHLVARMSTAERQRAAEHVSGCARCSAAWTADDVLRGEAVADPAPELFAAMLRSIAVAPARRQAIGRPVWLWLAGAAAALGVVAIAARWASLDPEPSAVPEPSSAPARSLAVSPFVEGRDYELLAGGAAKPVVDANGKIEVIEFFMFECFPCYAFEPDLDRWGSRASSDVSLTHVPALFNAIAELHARAYYTAEVLGKLDAMHDAFYDEIHERSNALASRAALADFFRRFGVDAATFDATFESNDVDARMRRAAALSREYGVRVTPTIVVAGRYSTSPGLAGSAMLAVVDQLVAESRACNDSCVDRRD
jgi:thiol:disulfide interchange protein DsbA